MRHEHRLQGRAFALRPLELDDAALVVGLRTDPERGRFLNATSARVEDQVAWTERYFEREGDFYFIVTRPADGSPEGAVALYDEDRAGRSAEWGRWILRPGSLAAPESALLIYRFGFETRGLDRLYCRTVAANEPVVRFHESAGLETVGRLPGYFGGEDSIEQRADRSRWPEIEARLDRSAALSARLMARRAA